MTSDQIELEVRVNGRVVGNIAVTGSASRRDMEIAAIEHPEARQLVGDDTVKKVEMVPGVSINILT